MVVTDVLTPLAVVIFRVKWRVNVRFAAKGVETSVTTTNTNSPSQDYTNLDDQLPQTSNA